MIEWIDMMDSRPPKDGTPILVYAPDEDFSPMTGIDLVWYEGSEEKWLFGKGDEYGPPFAMNAATHWAKLNTPDA